MSIRIYGNSYNDIPNCVQIFIGSVKKNSHNVKRTTHVTHSVARQLTAKAGIESNNVEVCHTIPGHFLTGHLLTIHLLIGHLLTGQLITSLMEN